MDTYICQFCGREFGRKCRRTIHERGCPANPERVPRKGRIPTNEDREKISKTIRRKVAEGTWHNSFSRSRTSEYKGQKFYGKWESGFAKRLDDLGITWRKCEESFAYPWLGKTSRYTPDFFIEELGAYIEVKGCPTERDLAKWIHFPKGIRLVVLFGEDLDKIGMVLVYKKVNRDIIREYEYIRQENLRHFFDFIKNKG